ncbi:MAG: cation:proton antiporter domain-containing protein, partial [Terriglobales bacterium]
LPASPDRLFDVYLDAKSHATFTGMPVKIEPRPGAEFSAFDGAISGKIGLPLVLGELIAGVILGPSFLNVWHVSWFTSHAQDNQPIIPVLKILADIGVVLLMFVAGLETDVEMMRKAVAPAFWAATGGVVLPMAVGAWVARAVGFNWQQSIFIGTILTATSVTITAQTLMNLKQLKSRAGSTILGAAVIDDVLGLIVLSVVVALAPRLASSGAGPNQWSGLGLTIGRMIVCLVILMCFGPYFTRWVFRRASRLHGHHVEIAAALVVAFFLAFQAEWLGGMAAITGSYLAGLFVAGTDSHETVSREIQPMINSFFAPLFFVSIGMEVNVWDLRGRLAFFLVLLAVAIFGKIVGCGLGARFAGFHARESLVVGVGMIPRGEVGLITASLGYSAGLVTGNVYVQVVMVVLMSTLVTPGLLRFVFPQRTGEAEPAIQLETMEEISLASAAGQNG